MRKKNLTIGYRVVFALLGLSAIVTELATLHERGKLVPSNFFSFFTIESNLFAVAVFLVSAMALAYGKQNKRVVMLRGANTLNMIVVGVVFAILLSGLDTELTAVPWDNTVLHYIMPIAVALDWFLDAPKIRIAYRHALVWMVFPITYVVYTLTRGAVVNWYPYPFLDPREQGYGSVAVTSIVLMVGTLGLVWVLVKSTQWRANLLRTKILLVALTMTVTAILGVGIFTIWHGYFGQQSPTPTQHVSQPSTASPGTPAKPKAQIASDETLGSDFAIAYPPGWTNAHSGAAEPKSITAPQTDENTITSPSGNVQVVLKVQTNTQIGGHCTNDYIKLKYLQSDTTPVYTDGRFAAYVVYYPATAFYQYHAGLQKNTEAIRGVSLGTNTACNFMFSEFIERASSLPGVPLTRTILSIRFVDLYGGENLKSGVDEVKVAEKLSGSEYEQAKAIVQSVYVK